MRIRGVLLCLVVGCSTVAQAAIRVVATDLTGTGFAADELRFLSSQLAQDLSLAGFKVTTNEQVAAVIGLERQRQLLGCSDDGASCMVEMASALGVDVLINGSVGKFGETRQLNVKAFSAKDGTVLTAVSRRVSNSNALLDAISAAAKQLAVDVPRQLGATLEPASLAPTDSAVLANQTTGATRGFFEKVPAIPAIAGAGVTAAGAVLWVLSRTTWAAMDRAAADPFPLSSLNSAKARGTAFQTSGYIALGVGLSTLIGTAIYAAVSDAAPAVSLSTPTPPNEAFARSSP